MKKHLFIFLTVILIFSATGCSQFQHTSDNSNGTDFYAMSEYKTFEELLSCATDFVDGICVGVEEKVPYDIYQFEVQDWIFGEKSNEKLHLYVSHVNYSVEGRNIKYSADDIQYTVGERYYLVLQCIKDACLDHDKYVNVGGNIYLPAKDIGHASMYGQKLETHSSGMQSTVVAESEIKNYILEKMEGNHAMPVYSLIENSDINTIVAESDFVFLITAEAEMSPTATIDRDLFRCKVVSVIKGNTQEGVSVLVPFPENRIQSGESYIVALFADQDSNEIFYLSSRNSIYSKEQLHDIQLICQTVENGRV